MINHIVLLRLKPGVDHADPRVRDALATLVALRGQIDGIERWDHGWNFTQRPVAYDYALDSTFRSRADLDAYGPHPAHQAAMVKLREVMDWVLCDFEAEAGSARAV
jgi:hypothetical protein